MVNAAGGGEDGGTSGSKGQADQAMPGYFERGLLGGVDLHNAAFTTEGSRDIQVAVRVECHALRTSQATVENGYRSLRGDAIDGIKAGGGGSGDEQISFVVEGEVIRGNARLEGSEDKDLPVACNLENGSAAVTDIEVLFAIKCDPGGHAHAFRISRHGAVGRNLVDSAVVARGDVHLSLAIEGDAGGVHHFGQKGLDVVVGVDFVDRHGDFLTARTRKGDVDVAFRIESRIGHGVQVLRNRHRDFNVE